MTSGRRVGSIKKIKKTKDGWLVGAAGRVSDLTMFHEWAEERDPTKFIELDDGFCGLLISPSGEVFVVEEDLIPFNMKAPFFSEGSGATLAFGAMAAGASAEEAVKIAIQYETSCGGKIQVLKL